MALRHSMGLAAAALAVAGMAFADGTAETVKRMMARDGFAGVEIVEGAGATLIMGRKGNAMGVVILDAESEYVIGQGKFQNGKMTGTDIVPTRAHKDDGVKYGDRDQDRNAGKGQGAEKSPAPGSSGGKATHTRGGGAGGGVNSGTGKGG